MAQTLNNLAFGPWNLAFQIDNMAQVLHNLAVASGFLALVHILMLLAGAEDSFLVFPQYVVT